MEYVAEYFVDGAHYTKTFSSLSGMAQWAGFNNLMAITETPDRFGCFRPRYADGRGLSPEEMQDLRVASAGVLRAMPSIFPPEVQADMRVLVLQPRPRRP